MSYASIFNKFPHKFLQPNSIAIFASLGLHVLFLAVILPNLSLSSGEGEQVERREVQVTELSPAEQSRLPDFSPSPPPLDVLSLPNSSALNRPLPDISALNLPNSTQLLPPPSLPQFEANIPPIPSVLPSLPTPALPPPPQIILPPARQIPPQAQPTPPESPSAPPPEVQQPAAAKPNGPPPSLPPLEPYATLPVLPPNPERTLRFPPPQPSVGARDLINQPTNAPAESSPPAGGQTAANNAESSPPPLPAPNAVEEERHQQLVAEVLKQRASLQEDQTETTDEEARKNFLDWSAAVKAGLKPTELSFAGDYPEDACIKKLEGTAAYGILVDAEGKITSTELIKSSGYSLFNERALQKIKTGSFRNQTGSSKPYLVKVNFDYSPETCPSLSLTPPEPANASEQKAPPAPVAAPSTPPTEAAAPEPKPEAVAPKPVQTPAVTPNPPAPSEAEPEPEPELAPAAAPKPTPTPAPSEADKPESKPAPVASPEPAQSSENTNPSESLGGPIETPNPFTQPTLDDSIGE